MRNFGLNKVLQHVCLFAGYAIAYYLTRETSTTNWQLTAGLRFAAFLFVPYRLWPAIFLGDIAGALAYRCNVVGQYGWEWLANGLLGTPLASAGPAFMLRTAHFQTWKLGLSKKVVGLLQAAGMASLLNAAVGILAMNSIHYSADVPKMPGAPIYFLSIFLLGNFIGILMVVPTIMTLRFLRTHRDTIACYEVKKMSVDFWRVAAWAVSMLLGLLVINRESPSLKVQAVTGLLMFAPSVVLTYRQGWNGAVAAAIFANVALQLTVRTDPTVGQFQMQVLMALISSALLLFGARMTEDKIKHAVIDKEHRHSLQLARRNLMWGESRVKHAAGIVERAFSSLQRFIDQTVIELAPSAPANAIATFKWTSAGLVNSEVRQSASVLRRSSLDTDGLRMALIAGPLTELLEGAGIEYPVRISYQVATLPADMQEIIFSVTRDLAILMAHEFNAYRIAVRLRVVNGNRPGVALVVKAWPGSGDRPSLEPAFATIEELVGVAQSYHGIFHDRRRRRRPTVSMLLKDN